ncbi:MAG: hypothetical protein R3Y59_11175, partial [bacterium]
MKKYLLILLLFPLFVLQAQDNIPYYHSFEESQTEENENWVLNYQPYTTIYNFWSIGNVLSSDGTKSLYMSIDGGVTHSYLPSKENTILAYRVFDISEPGIYDLSFDWMALGDGISSLMVAWIDDDVEYIMSTNSSNTAITTRALTTESGLTNMQLSAEWQNEITQIEVETGKRYKLVFAWYNSSSSVTANPPGAIDNISITSTNCDRVTDFEVDVIDVGSTASLTWNGSADSYGIKYKIYTDSTWVETKTTSTSASYCSLKTGVYYFAVRSICDGDTGVWVYSDKTLIYNALCIDYINLDSATCTYGTIADPYLYLGAIDHGSSSASSRHTVHFVQGELDANAIDSDTGYQLSTIPEGEIASVRIGNMESKSKAESITYEYTVDSTVAPVLMLKYALVLQAPGHGNDDDPEFQLTFLNEFGKELSSCTSATFTGTTDNVLEDRSNGWYIYRESDAVVWKDWTTVGINLAIYHGQKIKIRLVNLDCGLGGHYSYAYFTLGCSDGKLEGINCGDTPTDSFVAPDGFDYKWYLLSDPTQTSLSTDRIFYVSEDDINTYAVKVMFPQDNTCYFTLTASAIPRFPLAEATTEYIAENCTYTARLTNTSHVYTEYSDNTGETIESTYWVYPDGTVDAETEIDYPMPSDGSTVSLKLVASMGSGMCESIETITLQAPSILQDVDSVIDLKICSGGSFTFKGEELTETGVYVDSLKTEAGCYNITTLNLEVVDNIEIFISDTICANESYMFGDTTLNTSGTYIYESTSYLGCDSTATLYLEVIDVLSYLATDDLIACADDGAIMIPIS